MDQVEGKAVFPLDIVAEELAAGQHNAEMGITAHICNDS